MYTVCNTINLSITSTTVVDVLSIFFFFNIFVSCCLHNAQSGWLLPSRACVIHITAAKHSKQFNQIKEYNRHTNTLKVTRMLHTHIHTHGMYVYALHASDQCLWFTVRFAEEREQKINKMKKEFSAASEYQAETGNTSAIVNVHQNDLHSYARCRVELSIDV